MGKLKTDYKTFYDELMEMLTGERASPRIGEGAADHLIRWLSQNNAEPESGMLRKIVESLIPIQRTQKFEPFKEQGNDIYTAGVDPFSSSTAQQEPSQLETSHQRAPHLEIEAIDRPEYGRVCGFSEDDLVYSTSSRLNKSLLPSWKKSQRHIFETYNAKEYGLSEPRPDYCYGIVKNRFPDVNAAHISEYASVLIGVASNLLHAFLIVEGKSSKGSLADAENQAIRGGATIVYARRILNNKAGLPESVGPDRRSFSFSLTVDFGIARLWVHWCEVQKRQPGLDIDPADTTWILPDYYETYHMDCLVSCDFFKTEDVRSFQAAIKKVLDWGCLQRKSEVMKVLGMVARRERELVQCQDGGKGSESSRLAKRPRKEE
ncbi:hypothetical protein MMC21_007680 [Puttea exsequens]|nr:hypothetical protein [Puttea exsequens]